MSFSPEFLSQVFSQESNDPFLILVTMEHPSFSAPVRLVQNSENIISRGLTFQAFPMRISLPVDDGETARSVSIEFDNVSLLLLEKIRSVVNQSIQVKLEMVLASIPDIVQMELAELKIGTVKYDRQKIAASLYIDAFLDTAMTSESYTPQNFPGLF